MDSGLLVETACAVSAAAQDAPGVTGLVDEHGQPVESAQHKREVAAQSIGQLVIEWNERMLRTLATGVLAHATKELVAARTSVGQVKPGPKRMGFSLAFHIRVRFLKTARQPPAAVYDYKVAMATRRRREIIRQFAKRDDRTLRAAADAIIADTEFAAAVLDTWDKAFQEAKDAEDVARALGVDAGSAATAAQAAAEAVRTRDLSFRDVPRESSTPQLVTSATL
jgi:hypothetical protein